MAALVRALDARNRLEVNELIAQLVGIGAPLGAQWKLLAQASRRNGALRHARAAMNHYARHAGNTPLVHFEMAVFLAEIGDFTAAAASLRNVPENVPDEATHAHFAGTVALNLGEFDLARRSFRRTLLSRPRSGQTWLSFAETMRGVDPSGWTGEILAARSAMELAPPGERGAFQYALGAALHALRDHDRAFDAFALGAQFEKALRPYSPEADLATAVQARTSAALPDRPETDTSRPIFVFGPPRSGTTLVEQILTSHSAVTDGGEIRLFDLVASEVGGLGASHLKAAISQRGIDALAQDYLTLLKERFGTTGRIVDKTLTATRYAGLIASILPEAPLIWVARDPLDTGWSCFRTHFNQGVNWSWDQDDLARHLLLEDEVLKFWSALLGDRLLVLRYDRLVANPTAEISRVLKHCGLAPEPPVFESHKTERAVSTASASQVRQPINRSGIGVAAPYRRHLQPFIDAYGYER